MRGEHAGYVCGAALGFLADLIAADPRRGHPVAAFGRAAGAVERRLWRDHRGYGAAARRAVRGRCRPPAPRCSGVPYGALPSPRPRSATAPGSH